MPISTIHAEQWLQFRNHAVRELAFVIASPPLLQHWTDPTAPHTIILPDSHFWQQHYAHYLPRLKQLDQHPTDLYQHLSTLRSSRLGIRFEALLTFWLLDMDYHPFQLIGKNIQRKEQQRTVGELDFLLRNTDTQHIEHWEVAIKFYLGEDTLSPSHWIGLNRIDTLAKKLNHLYTHQFCATAIEQHQIQTRKAIIKGRLFYPTHQPIDIAHLPTWLNPHHLQGQWGYELPSQCGSFSQIRYAYRNEWFCHAHNPQNIANTAPYYRQGLYLLQQHQHITHYMLRTINSHRPFLPTHLLRHP